MRDRTYWRSSLALPLLCPAAAFILIWVLALFPKPPEVATKALGMVLLSGYSVGIPYLVFAALVLAVLWRRPVRAYQRTALVAPILFVACLVLGLVVYFITVESTVGPALTSGFRAYCLLSVVVGYAYVGVVFLGAWALEQLHMLEHHTAVGETSA